VIGTEEHLLGCLFSRPDLLAMLDAELIDLHVPPLVPEDLDGAENRAALASLQASLPAVAAWEPAEIVAAMPEALHDHCRSILEHAQGRPALTDDKLLKDLGDLVLRLRKNALYQQVSQLRYLMVELEESGERDQLRRYQELMTSYTTRIRQLQKLLNMRTMVGALAQASKNANGTPMKADSHER
jgi:hypothetical protein